MTNEVLDAEIVTELPTLDLAAADEAIIAVERAVANAAAHLGRARLALLRLEVFLADANKKTTVCPQVEGQPGERVR